MKYLILCLLFAVSIEAQAIKPLSRGILDTVSGITGPTGECPPSLGGRLEAWCFAYTKCFDTTCVNSMAQIDTVPGSDPGGKLLQIISMDDCERSYSSKQDTQYVFQELRLKSNVKYCVDTLRASINSGQNESGCFISMYDQFTIADKLRLSSREPFIDSTVSPIALWKYTCDE